MKVVDAWNAVTKEFIVQFEMSDKKGTDTTFHLSNQGTGSLLWLSWFQSDLETWQNNCKNGFWVFESRMDQKFIQHMNFVWGKLWVCKSNDMSPNVLRRC